MNDGGPAFPVDGEYRVNGVLAGTCGMTLRDYFAAKAMAALIENRAWVQSLWSQRPDGSFGDFATQTTAESAYAFADAMLAEREKQK